MELDPSLVHYLRAEKHSCATETQSSEKDRDSKKHRAGESENNARKEKTAEHYTEDEITSQTKEEPEIVFIFILSKRVKLKGGT